MTFSWIPLFHRVLQSKAYRTITYVAAGSWCEVISGPEIFQERFIIEAALVNMDHVPFINATFVVPSEFPVHNTSEYQTCLDSSTQYYHVKRSASVPSPTPEPVRTVALRPTRTRARVPPPLTLRPFTEVTHVVARGASPDDSIPSTQDITAQGTPPAHTAMSGISISASSLPAPVSLTGVGCVGLSNSESSPPQPLAAQTATTSSSDTPSAAVLLVTPSSAPLSPASVVLAPASPIPGSSPNWADLMEEEEEGEDDTASSSLGTSHNNGTSPLPSPYTPPTPDFPTSLEDGQPLQKIYVNAKDLSPLCIALDLPLAKHMRPQAVPDTDALSDAFLRERFLKTLDLAVRECNDSTWAEYLLGIYLNGGYDWENPSSSSSSSTSSSSSPSLSGLPKLRQYIPVVDSEAYERQYENELLRANEVEWREQDYTTVEDLARVNTDWQFMYTASKEMKAEGDYRRPVLEATDRSVDWFWNTAGQDGSRSYDPREFSCPKVGYAPQMVKVAEVHHLNFSHQPVTHKNSTAPEVSLWAAWSSGLVEWHHDADLTRRRVLASQAAKLLDPFYCNDQMDPAILELQGDALREAVAEYVRKVYSQGTWVNDHYNSKSNTPLSSHEYECCTIDSEVNRPVQSYFVYAGVDEDSSVIDDGRPTPFMPSKVRKPKGCSPCRTIESVDGEVTIIESGKVIAPTRPIVDRAVAQPQRSRMFIFGDAIPLQPNSRIRGREVSFRMEPIIEVANVDSGTQIDRLEDLSESSEGTTEDKEPTASENGSATDSPFKADPLLETPSGQYGMCTPGIKKALEKYINKDDAEEESSIYSDCSPSKGYGSRQYVLSPANSSYTYECASVSLEYSLNGENLDESSGEEYPSEEIVYECVDDSNSHNEFLSGREDSSEGGISNKSYEGDSASGSEELNDDIQDMSFEDGEHNSKVDNDTSKNGDSSSHDGASSTVEDTLERGSDGHALVLYNPVLSHGQTQNSLENVDSIIRSRPSSAIKDTPEQESEDYALVLYNPNMGGQYSPLNVIPLDEDTADVAADISQALTQNFAYGAGDDDYFDQDSVIDDDEDGDNVPTLSDTTVFRQTMFSPAEQNVITEFLGSQIPALHQIGKIMDVSSQDDQEQHTPRNEETVLEVKKSYQSPSNTPWHDQPRYSENCIAANLVEDSESEEVLEQGLQQVDITYEEDITNILPLSKGIDKLASQAQEINQYLEASLLEPQADRRGDVPTSISLVENVESTVSEQLETPELSEEELLNLPFREFEDLSEIPDIRLGWPELIYGSFAISLGQKAREMLRFS